MSYRLFHTLLFNCICYPVCDGLSQVLHRALSPGIRRQNVLSSRTPYNLTKSASRTRNRHHLMNPKCRQRAILNRSDCEDNSSGEEEFTRVRFSKITHSVLIFCIKKA